MDLNSLVTLKSLTPYKKALIMMITTNLSFKKFSNFRSIGYRLGYECGINILDRDFKSLLY